MMEFRLASFAGRIKQDEARQKTTKPQPLRVANRDGGSVYNPLRQDDFARPAGGV